MIMWMNEALNREIYDLTQLAIHADDPEQVKQVLWRFEDIVQLQGYGLPVQKAYLLWESGKISTDRLILFLEDCYKWSANIQDEKIAKDLRDETVRWTFHLLWKVTQPPR